MDQGQRLTLHEVLKNILGEPNGFRAFFQPPPSFVLSYPCIVYKLDDIRTDHADNAPYNHQVRYQVTVIDRNPDSEIPGKVAKLPKCGFDRAFTADGLNHFVFNLFF